MLIKPNQILNLDEIYKTWREEKLYYIYDFGILCDIIKQNGGYIL